MLTGVTFLHWPLLLLLPLAALPWVMLHPRFRRTGAIHAQGALLRGLAGTARTRSWWLSPTLRTAAIAIIVVSLARPVVSNQESRAFTEGVAIELVVDRSGSMLAEDFSIGGKRTDRLTAVKHVASNFIGGGEGLAGRPHDLIGLTMFAGFADTISPLTTDHEYLIEAMRAVPPATDPSEGGTAIGDALSLGIERLRDARESANRDGVDRVKGAALILLTDGENNAGETEPLSAAQLAKTLGIRVYAIGVGTRGMAPMPVHSADGRVIGYQQQPVSIDEELLTQMADATGGKYFRATDTAGLQRIYEAIDALEKSRVEHQVRTFHRDLAVQGFRFAGREVPPLLAVAAALLLLDAIVAATWGRQLGGSV